MASHTRPFLTSGVALASAAAVVLATPAITPGIASSSLSASTARYELATFADVFTIPAGEWVNAYFQGYGGFIGPNNTFPLEPYAGYCDGSCFVFGVSGVLYQALDAIINGTGGGWDDRENWAVSAVNYLFEADWTFDPGGISAGLLYLLQTSVGSANPLLSTAITLAFAGPQLVTIIFDNVLQLVGDAALGLPLVGQYAYGAINAFLGPASLNPDFADVYTVGGVSGVLEWALDVLTGQAPEPPAPEVPAVSAAVEAPAADAVEADAADTAEVPAADTAGSDAADAAEVPAADTAGSDAADTAEVPAADTAGSDAADTAEVPAADTAPVTAAEVKAETAEATDAAEAAPPAKATAKRPVRDALAKVTTSITSSIGSALAGKPAAGEPAATQSADSGSTDSGSADDAA